MHYVIRINTYGIRVKSWSNTKNWAMSSSWVWYMSSSLSLYKSVSNTVSPYWMSVGGAYELFDIKCWQLFV